MLSLPSLHTSYHIIIISKNHSHCIEFTFLLEKINHHTHLKACNAICLTSLILRCKFSGSSSVGFQPHCHTRWWGVYSRGSADTYPGQISPKHGQPTRQVQQWWWGTSLFQFYARTLLFMLVVLYRNYCWIYRAPVQSLEWRICVPLVKMAWRGRPCHYPA